MTHEIRYAIRDAGFPAGLATVVVPGGGSGVVIAEPIPAVLEGLKKVWGALAEVATATTKEQEATTHDTRKRPVAILPRLQGAALGPTCSIPFHDGKLCLDPYTDIFLVDFEPATRRREVMVQVLGKPAEEAAPARRGPARPGPRAQTTA